MYLSFQKCDQLSRPSKRDCAEFLEMSCGIGLATEVWYAFRPGHQVCAAARSAVRVCGAAARAASGFAVGDAPGSEPLSEPGPRQLSPPPAERTEHSHIAGPESRIPEPESLGPPRSSRVARSESLGVTDSGTPDSRAGIRDSGFEPRAERLVISDC